MKLDIANTYLWSDIQVALTWIKGDKGLPVFVRNRLCEIKGHSDIVMSSVSSKENPADVATKGTTAKALHAHDQWWHEPDWLSRPSSEWKTNDIIIEFDADTGDSSPVVSITEQRKSKEKHFNNDSLGIECERFSSITKLLLVTVSALRFIRKI